MNPLNPSENAIILPVFIALTLVCLALSQPARAECREGCDSLGNTFLGEEALNLNTWGFSNTAIGDYALTSNIGTDLNTAIGSAALINNTDGSYNTATGAHALFYNTFGNNNTANGAYTLLENTTGGNNTATGYSALHNNTTAYSMTAVGAYALYNNTTGIENTATGGGALYSNTTGVENTASGLDTLYSNATGNYNTATGSNALYNNLEGNGNTATGAYALVSNTRGIFNTATGFDALVSNTTGDYNTSHGVSALFYNTTGFNNTAVGQDALYSNTTGANNVACGYLAGYNLTTGNNNIIIGANVLGGATDANTTRIGASTQTKTFISGISGKTVANGVTVLINSSGRLGTIQSSARYKDAIQPMDKASEGVLALQPVTFRYKKEIDPDGVPQFGLVAEDVEKVNPDLVVRDDQGKPYTVRYEAVNAMLLNEFLKEHKKVEEQQATIAELKSTVAQQQNGFQSQLVKQQKQIDALTAGLQKVGAQLELSQSAPPTVLNNQ